MSSGNTSFQNPVRGKGEDQTGLLVVAVAVLGTLVAVGLVVGSVWACVVCNKVLYHQRKRHKTQKIDIDGFPHHPREMVELGHIPCLPYSQDHGPYSTNNTGISRSIGICTSKSPEQFPAVPAPKSWTPSPPLASKQDQTPLYNPKYSSCIHHKNKEEKEAKNLEKHSQWKKNIPSNIKGGTSVYHPHYNTYASDVWSVEPALSNSSGSQILCVNHPPPQEVDQHVHRNTSSGKNHLTKRWESKRYNKQLYSECPRHRKKIHAHVDSHQLNEYNHWKSDLDEGTEAPDACSSHRGSPSNNHLVCLSRHQQQSRPSRAETSNNIVSYLNPVCNEASNVHKNSAVHSSIPRQNMIKRKPKEKRQERFSKYHRIQPDPTQSITSTKSRRLWKESSGFKNEVLPTEHTSARGSGPCWIHNSQRQHRQPDPKPGPSTELPIVCETLEQEVFQSIARKYGFCETCGCEKSLMQQREGACGGDRSCGQFNDYDEQCGSSIDSTPSMSWDNLTPEPTPALTNTQPLQAAHGTNLSHSNNTDGKENSAFDGCDTFAPPCGSTYTKSYQSGGEG